MLYFFNRECNSNLRIMMDITNIQIIWSNKVKPQITLKAHMCELTPIYNCKISFKIHMKKIHTQSSFVMGQLDIHIKNFHFQRITTCNILDEAEITMGY